MTFSFLPHLCTATANSTTAARRQITFVNTGVPIIVAILGSITAAIAALTSWVSLIAGLEYGTEQWNGKWNATVNVHRFN